MKQFKQDRARKDISSKVDNIVDAVTEYVPYVVGFALGFLLVKNIIL